MFCPACGSSNADENSCSSCGAAFSKGVIVTDIRMRFWSMVGFMVKWAIASIPAAIILFLIVGVLQTLMVVAFFVGLFYYYAPFHKIVVILYHYTVPGVQ
jgi:hypothetical protein